MRQATTGFGLSEAFKTGVLNLAYVPADSIGDATYEDAKIHLAPPEQSEQSNASNRSD